MSLTGLAFIATFSHGQIEPVDVELSCAVILDSCCVDIPQK